MAEVKVSIGGRDFEVACRDGEEHFLLSAAQMLDNEASALNEALGRMPETRMLLMSGLMLADKTASLEDKLKSGQPVAAPADDSDWRKRAKKAERQLGRTVEALEAANARVTTLEAEAAAAPDPGPDSGPEIAALESRAAEAEKAAQEAQAALEESRAQASKEAEAAKQAAAQRDSALSALRRVVEKVEAAANPG